MGRCKSNMNLILYGGKRCMWYYVQIPDTLGSKKRHSIVHPVPISDLAINMHLETYLTRIKSYFLKKSSN